VRSHRSNLPGWDYFGPYGGRQARQRFGDRSWGQLPGPSRLLREAQGLRPRGQPSRIDPRKEGGKRDSSNPPAKPSASMVRRGSTVRVRQRALGKASKWPFLLRRHDTTGSRPTRNLSPRSVPTFESEHLPGLNRGIADHRAPPVEGDALFVRCRSRALTRRSPASPPPSATRHLAGRVTSAKEAVTHLLIALAPRQSQVRRYTPQSNSIRTQGEQP
jgi:hypothetical protein